MRHSLHALLVLCLTATGALAQTGTPQTKTQLGTEQGANFPDNTTGLITPSILRQTMVDFIASWQQAPRINAQSGVTYTVSVDDYGKMVTLTNGASIAVTLPQATTTFATFNFLACTRGAGTVTITPTTSNINGNATLVLGPSQCSLIVSDGTNYQATPPGVVTCSGGLSLVSGACQLSAARQTNPTTQTFTTGTNATYTTPANVLWIEIWLTGGGGGGAGGGVAGESSGGAGGDTCWKASGTACTSPLYDAGGGAGGVNTTTSGGAGGTVSGSATCVSAFAGGGGGGGNPGVAGAGGASGGGGGNSWNGGGGLGTFAVTAGGNGGTNTGGGGAGGGVGTTGVASGGGGGSGAGCYAIINAPAGSYVYTVGAAGSSGGAGTNGGAGGSGAVGHIRVVEHYGS